ncbi:MAG: hypothetical protein ACFB03_20520 [Paracoccaceae bacterium]
MFADRENKTRVNTELLQLIELGLALNGKFSARSASIAVVGHDGLVRDIRQKGNVPTADKVDALFKLLGISYNLGAASPNNESLPVPRGQKNGRSALQLISVGGDSPRLIGNLPNGPFTLQVRFDICDRLKEGWYGFVDPFQKPENRDIVFLRDRVGTPQIAIFHSGAASDPRHVAIESLTGERRGIEFVSVTSYTIFAPITWTGRVSPDIQRSYDVGDEGRQSRFNQLKGLVDEIRDDAAVEEVDLSHIELVEKAIQLLKDH